MESAFFRRSRSAATAVCACLLCVLLAASAVSAEESRSGAAYSSQSKSSEIDRSESGAEEAPDEDIELEERVEEDHNDEKTVEEPDDELLNEQGGAAEPKEQGETSPREEEEEEEAAAEEETLEAVIQVEDEHHREVLGWVEPVRLYPENVLLNAKLTPGSEGNVMHAENIEVFTKDGEKWVRFRSIDRKGKMHTLERPVVDEAKFRTTKGKIEKRYEVIFPFCLHKVYLEIPFALADRSKFEHEMRIGRDALAGHFIVDPAKAKTSKPRCKVPSSKKSDG